MPAANFYLKSGAASERLVYLFYSYNGNRLKYSTGLTVAPEYWNENKQQVKETRQFPRFPEFNAFLKNLANEAERLYLNCLNSGHVPTPEELRVGLDKYRGRAADAPQRGLFSYIELLIDERTASPKFRHGSIKQYRNVLNKVRDFASVKRKGRLDFKDITPEFWEQFRDYLYSQNLAENTVHKQLRILKTILADAVEKGATNGDEIYTNTKRLGVSAEPVQKIYLTLEELETLYNLPLPPNSRLARVRDLFLIGAFTGLRYADFTQIRPEHFKTIGAVEVLELDTQKTGERVTIPLHPFVKSVLKTNGGVTPKGISNQKMNDYLKELGQMAGFNDLIIVTKKIGGIPTTKTYRKFELLVTHTARRSFATNAYKMGIPSLSIMRITAHRTEAAFMRYIQITKEENALLMARSEFFNPAPSRVAK